MVACRICRKIRIHDLFNQWNKFGLFRRCKACRFFKKYFSAVSECRDLLFDKITVFIKELSAMKKSRLLIIFLFTQLTICKSFTLDTNKWNDFSGLVGKKEIRLSLFPFPDGTLKGNYCYKKYETKIQLTGTIKGDRIELTELLNGKTNGF